MSAARAGERIARRSRGYVCFDVAWAQGCVFLGMAFGVAGPPVVSPLLSCSGSWGTSGRVVRVPASLPRPVRSEERRPVCHCAPHQTSCVWAHSNTGRSRLKALSIGSGLYTAHVHRTPAGPRDEPGTQPAYRRAPRQVIDGAGYTPTDRAAAAPRPARAACTASGTTDGRGPPRRPTEADSRNTHLGPIPIASAERLQATYCTSHSYKPRGGV